MGYRVIIETDFRDRPKEHELSAAILLANYFKTNIVFLRPSCQRTPDLDIGGNKWELKSPIGNGKNTIKNNLHSARAQSVNVVIDLRRIKMHQSRALSNINHYLTGHHTRIRHLLIILKSEKILEIL